MLLNTTAVRGLDLPSHKISNNKIVQTQKGETSNRLTLAPNHPLRPTAPDYLTSHLCSLSFLKLHSCGKHHLSTQLTSKSRSQAVVVSIQQPVQDAGENGDVIFAVINDV